MNKNSRRWSLVKSCTNSAEGTWSSELASSADSLTWLTMWQANLECGVSAPLWIGPGKILQRLQRGFASDRGRVFGFSELAGIESGQRITLSSRQFRKTEHPTPRSQNLTHSQQVSNAERFNHGDFTVMVITLIGYRGTGKSTLAAPLAERLGWEWLDADVELERRAGCSIKDIFATGG